MSQGLGEVRFWLSMNFGNSVSTVFCSALINRQMYSNLVFFDKN